jgi:tetratricopeptide (TPR) repeat protein
VPAIATIDLDAHIQIAMTHHRQGQLAQALAMYNELLEMDPHNAQANHLVGLIALQRKAYLQAIEKIEFAITQQPNEATYHLNLGVAFKAIKQHARALNCFQTAIQLAPHLANAHFNLAVVLQATDQLEAALASYQQAIALAPSNASYLSNYGAALQMCNQFDAAIACYDQAMILHPNDHTIRWNKSLALLHQGDFEQGLPMFEARWQRDSFTSAKRSFHAPLWLGQDCLQDKRILLHGEQGLGDFLQFCRYVALVAARGAYVILETPPALAALVQPLQGVSELVIAGKALPSYDYHCPLMSLPLACQTRLDSIPPPAQPLYARPPAPMQWAALANASQQTKVGFVWHGNAAQKNDRHRSMPLEVLLSALPPGKTYVSLQKDITSQEKQTLANTPHVIDMSDAIHDFADTAALCNEMDLVISVCTSVAHLSATLQRPTWILLAHNADWRWLAQRDDSPWYPSAKLYRQTQRQDWSTVTDAIHQDLLKLQPSFT